MLRSRHGALPLAGPAAWWQSTPTAFISPRPRVFQPACSSTFSPASRRTSASQASEKVRGLFPADALRLLGRVVRDDGQLPRAGLQHEHEGEARGRIFGNGAVVPGEGVEAGIGDHFTAQVDLVPVLGAGRLLDAWLGQQLVEID